MGTYDQNIQEALSGLETAIEQVNKATGTMPDESGQALIFISTVGGRFTGSFVGDKYLQADMLMTVAKHTPRVADLVIMVAAKLLKEGHVTIKKG